MFGKNPIRAPEKGDGLTLQVVTIFPTLQGEGPFAGHPAVFIRLGGCNLACGFCDTEFEQFQSMALQEITRQILALSSPLEGERDASFAHPWGDSSANIPLTESAKGKFDSPSGVEVKRICDLVVITGGEPLRQNIAPLCEELLAEGLRVQIETNGTLWRELPEAVSVICSPKMTDGRYHPLRADLLARVNALKFIVSADDTDYRDVDEVGQAGTSIPIYVQPMDVYDAGRNAANLAYAANLAQTHGYRLSVQLHKLLGIE